MLPTPAHDGVRLMLPAFAFLAILAGWGIAGTAEGLSRRARGQAAAFFRYSVHALFLAPAAWALIAIHPYELSYYNALVGGPRGAWNLGFELTYWYDAFTPQFRRDINRKLPAGAEITFPSKLSEPVMVVQDLQSLGALRGDLVLGWTNPNAFPYQWLLTHDSKADPYTRLLFQMRPWYASRPCQLDGARVATVADPVAVSRAWALRLLADGGPRRPTRDSPLRRKIQRLFPWLALWQFDDRNRVWPSGMNDAVYLWALRDPKGLIAAARTIASGGPFDDDARRLRGALHRFPESTAFLLRIRPEALVEAARIFAAHPQQVFEVINRESYADPERLGGYLDRDLD
jgi:hypothetical protein